MTGSEDNSQSVDSTTRCGHFGGSYLCDTSVAVSPDGKFIVTGSGDGRPKCGTATKECVGTLEVIFGYTQRRCLCKFIVTGSWDNTAEVWDSHEGVWAFGGSY